MFTAETTPTPKRIEVHPFSSRTMTAQEFLTGQSGGQPVSLAGILKIPPSDKRQPAVVLMHGSDGSSQQIELWADYLNGLGFSTFTVDSFTGRGIVNTIQNQGQLSALSMIIDAYRALDLLAGHPRLDPERIAIMGFSRGAVAAVYSSLCRFQKLWAPRDLRFAAHLGFYTPCNVTYRDDERVSPVPIRLLHGRADDYVPVEPCRPFVGRLRRAGADIRLIEYEDAHHNFDDPTAPQPILVHDGQTSRRCSLFEADDGVIVNAQTRIPFTLSDDCVERGAHVGYNASAHRSAQIEVEAVLRRTFSLDTAIL